MTWPDFDPALIGGSRGVNRLVDTVVAAGEAALQQYNRGAAETVTQKPDRSPVTQADQDVEEYLRSFIKSAHPTAEFWGEEGGREQAVSQSKGPKLRFIVDPIDGTRAFLRGIPTWSVLLALEVDEVPSLGIAFMPAAGDLFVGALGHGAMANGRPVHLSRVQKLEDAVVSHGGLQQFVDGECEPLLGQLARKTYTQRGFADFDGYRQLLLGRVDAMVDPGIKAWDIAVPAVLVRAAGGRLTDMRGDPSIHNGGALSSNGHFHDALVSLSEASQQKDGT